MGSAYNGAQTLQGEGGDFNIVNTYLLNVYDEASFKGDVNFEGAIEFLGIVTFKDNVGFFEETYFSSSINVGGPASNPGIIKSPEVELVEYNSSTQGWVSYNPPKLLSELFEAVEELQGGTDDFVIEGDLTVKGNSSFESNLNAEDGIKTTDVELGTFSNGSFTRASPRRRLSTLFDDVDDLDTRVTTLESATFESVDLTPITTRLNALEAIDFSQPDLSNLTDGLDAIQTRTDTLESLIGLLNNNNPTDTVLENRITNLESKITALISVYQSIKAIHNMPINLS
jgi:hypothetical protein